MNFLNNLYKNRKNIFFIFFKSYFKYLFFRAKFNRRFFKYRKQRRYFLLRKKFLHTIGNNIYKNIRRKNFFSIFNKYNKKNIYTRSFFVLNNLYYNLKFKRKILANEFDYRKHKKKKRKIKNLRILKKLKTFYYNPDGESGMTRQQVYKRFKKSVMRKFSRKFKIKKKPINAGLKFNVSVYNARNRYKNRMKALELKKNSTPMYFFFKNKKNNYVNTTNLGVVKRFSDLPFFMKKRYKFNTKKRKFFPRKIYHKKLNCLRNIVERFSKKNEFF